jgi:hypothetical protein
MDNRTSNRAALWIAAFIVAAATAYGLHETYALHSSIDAVAMPAQYRR